MGVLILKRDLVKGMRISHILKIRDWNKTKTISEKIILKLGQGDWIIRKIADFLVAKKGGRIPPCFVELVMKCST